MPGSDERYQKEASIISREIAGEVLLVPVRRNIGDLESIFTLNETAARVWELIDGARTLGEIRDQIIEEYEVGEQEAEQDLFELIEQLVEVQAVVKV